MQNPFAGSQAPLSEHVNRVLGKYNHCGVLPVPNHCGWLDNVAGRVFTIMHGGDTLP
ncbi:hypothetical protein [Coleofasciculus sp. F4-SAH-05]|uniref:hypothetical protein n=1 Tax=Coleofasciculus sp. F4-SAH-05 TaxID=3069525 RepID=UPI0032FB7604